MNEMRKLLLLICFCLAAMSHAVYAQQSKSGAPFREEVEESDVVRLAREAKSRAGAGKKYSNTTLGQLQEARVSYTTQWEPPKVRPAAVEIPESPSRRGQGNVPAPRKQPKKSKQKAENQDIDRKLTRRGIRILYLRRGAVRSRSGKNQRAQPVAGLGWLSGKQSTPVRR